MKNEGYCPIPHFAARSIESEKIFEESLAKLRQEANVNEALLIGGGVDIPVGPFTASIEILRTGLFDKYGFNRIGVAGHPEGSPDITPKECEQAIREKNEFNQHTDADLYLATQFLFEAKPLFQWEKTIRNQGTNCLSMWEFWSSNDTDPNSSCEAMRCRAFCQIFEKKSC